MRQADGISTQPCIREAEAPATFAGLKQRMRQLACRYAGALPARDTTNLILGLDGLLSSPPAVRQMPLGEREGAFDPVHNVILINEAASPRRQRFTLAHEIGHVLLLSDDDLLSDLHELFEGEQLETALETLCNVAAAEILMPASWVRELLQRFGPSGRALAKLAQQANVSASAAIYALAEQTQLPTLYAVCGLTQAGQGRLLAVLASAGAHTRYTLAVGTAIPENHTVYHAYTSGLPEAAESYVPFRSGRKMPAYVQAYPVGRQVLSSFNLPNVRRKN